MRPFLTAALFGLCIGCLAQKNLTGKYGYQESYKSLKERIPNAGKDESGYSQKLFLIRLHANQYRFWLYVIKGYPSYNSGEISGDITVQNNKALFSYTDSVVIGISCRLDFQFQEKRVVIKQGEENCGFGHGVSAAGEYPKISSSLTTQDLIGFGQQTRAKFSVTTVKAYLYSDEAGSKRKEQYFLRGDAVYAFDETKDMIFIEHITQTGKYVEGWLHRKELQLSKTSRKGSPALYRTPFFDNCRCPSFIAAQQSVASLPHRSSQRLPHTFRSATACRSPVERPSFRPLRQPFSSTRSFPNSR